MDSSPFFKLPAELRLRIYELALYEDSKSRIELSFNERTPSAIPSISPGPFSTNKLSLSSACHQLRNESLPIFTALHTLCLNTSILGPHIQLVAGKPFNPTGNMTAPVNVLHTWLSWSGGGYGATVEIHLGVWYTWWERATPEIVAPSAKRFAAVITGSKAHVTLSMAVEWCATPMMKEDFHVQLPLWDLPGAKRRVEDRIAEKQEWVEAQSTRYYLLENLDTCRRKFDELFDLLEGETEDEEV